MVSKIKFEFLDGTIRALEPFHPLYKVLQWCNTLLHGWVVNTISPSVAKSVDAIKDVADVWRDLQEC